MNQWSRTRKRIILGIVFLAVAIFIGVPLFFIFYQKPSCSDNKLNGDEKGVDCGGSCQRLCSAESLPLILKGDPRILTIAPDTYEVIAVIENPNQSAEIHRAEYIFKLYDATSVIPVKTIEGFTFVPKGKMFALFEGPFTLPSSISPVRATLEWKNTTLTWKKSEGLEPDIALRDIVLSRSSTTPRLDAIAQNRSLGSVSNIDFVALISDASGNIFAASKTFIDTLEVGEEEPIIFAWPRPFVQGAADIQIIQRVFPDRSFIR